jgi:hypothetical protein
MPSKPCYFSSSASLPEWSLIPESLADQVN